jgi:septal ring factor EnvC (AmiA/AmiB activator)
VPLTSELEEKIRETHAGVLVLKEWRIHLNGSVEELKKRVSNHEGRLQQIESTLTSVDLDKLEDTVEAIDLEKLHDIMTLLSVKQIKRLNAILDMVNPENVEQLAEVCMAYSILRWMAVVLGGSIIALIWSLIIGRAQIVFK